METAGFVMNWAIFVNAVPLIHTQLSDPLSKRKELVHLNVYGSNGDGGVRYELGHFCECSSANPYTIK
jgi:hypothetical protein